MKDLEYYLNLPYKIEIEKIPENDGGGYCAMMPEFKGAALFWGDGKSEVEALKDLKLAFKSALTGLIESGKKIPEPKAKTDKTKSIAITLKQSVIDRIDRHAKELGISRSALIFKGMDSYLNNVMKA